MAAEKKKTDKKTAEKKPAKKPVASAKAAVKAGKKNSSAQGHVTINVPQGGQVIKYFNLMPALPSTTAPGDWIFTEDCSATDISLLTVKFPENPSPLERELERAILVVSIQQNADTDGTWRFALGGVATDHADEDPSNDVVVEVIDNGFTLLVYVQVVTEENKELIPFGFVASFTNRNTGVVSIYESQDPGVQPRRP